MRILIVGAGAVGGYFGAQLAKAGRDVTFLVREGRAAQLRRTGLQVHSPHGDYTIEPSLLIASDLQQRPQTFDLILLSVKAYSLEAAMNDFAPAVASGTLILPLLNGMRHLDALDARFGAAHVLGGSTRISADLDAEGGVHSFEDLQDLVYGARFERTAAPLAPVDEALQGCGFDDKLSNDIMAFMWQKWTILSSLASITCLLRGTVGEVEAARGGPETARAIITEAAAIAGVCGYPTTPAFLDVLSSRLTVAGSSLTASMYRDMMRGLPVEADQILGDLLLRGEEHGVQTPLLRAAYVQLSVYAAARERERAAGEKA